MSIQEKLKQIDGIEMVDIVNQDTIHIKSWKYANNEGRLQDAIEMAIGVRLDVYCDGDDWFVVNL